MTHFLTKTYSKFTFKSVMVFAFFMTWLGSQQVNAQVNDLSLGISSNIDSTNTGGTVIWTITVTNQGGTNVTGVNTQITLPAGLTYASHSTAAGTYNSGTGVWNIGAISSSTPSVTLTITTNVTGESVLAIKGEITSMTEADGDSTPNNSNYFEDDIAFDCVSVPMWYCFGKPINITAAALSGFVSYQWKRNGVDIAGATNPTYTITQVGEYTYSVLGGASGSCSGVMCCPIKVKMRTSAPLVNAGADNAICNGASTQIVAVGSSGAPTYTYAWSPTTALTSATIANPFASPTVTTTYVVTMTDINGCTATDDVVITVNNRPIANAGSDVTICEGLSTPLLASATNGTAPYNYSWNPTNGLSAGNVANPTANPTVTTTYTVLVADANGCTTSDDVIVTVNPRPLVNAGADVSICNTSNTVLTAVGSAGTAAYSYAWGPSTGLSGTTTATVTATPSATQTYIVTLTDSKGCQATDNVVVTVQSKPTVAVTANSTICVNVAVPLDVTVTGGTGTMTYAWSPGTGLSAANVKNPTATPLATTTYTVTATDANGCSNTGAVTITVNTRPTANAGPDVTICEGLTTTLGASATGGVTPYTYSWVANATLSATNVANPVANPIVTTSYTVIVADANGCTTSDAVIVHVNPKPNVNAGADVSICNQSSTVLAAGGNAGTPGYTYLWSPGATLSGTTTATVTATPTSTTTYNVTLTDSEGCTATDNIVVTIQPKPTVAVTANSTICVNVAVPLDVTVTGGTGSMTYAWSPGTGLSAANVKNPTATPLATTTYTVTATDANGCSNTGAVTITVNTRPTANAGPDVTICEGLTTTLGASATGGVTPYTYSWVANATLSATNVANPVANPIVTTSYTVIVADANGCTTSDAVIVHVNPKPNVNAGADVSICNQSSTVLAAGGNAGTPGYTYLWSPGATLSGTTTATVTATPTATTTYNVTLTDSEGCTATDNIVVTIQPKPTVTATPNTTICVNATVPLDVTVTGGTGSMTYAWSPATGLSAANVKNPTATPTATTTYTVTATDVNGCSNTGTVTITVNPRPTVNAGSDVTICAQTATTLAANATGGTAPYSYSWSPNTGLSGTNTATVTATPTTVGANTYTVIIADVNGCTSSDAVVVTVDAKPTLDLGADVTICAGSAQTLTTTPAVGTAPYTYTWAASQGTVPTGASPSVSPTVTTTYTVTATDAKGCTVVDVIVVNVNTPVTAGIATNPAALCQAGSGLTTVNLAAQIAGETAGGTWTVTAGVPGTAFNAGAGTLNPNGLAVGTYTFRYTVTATAPCPGDTEDVTVTINDCCPPQICLPVTTTRN